MIEPQAAPARLAVGRSSGQECFKWHRPKGRIFPSVDEVLAVRRERMAAVKQTIAALTPEELERCCVPPDAHGHPTEPASVLECLHVILEEEWEHSRYANRDLAILGARPR